MCVCPSESVDVCVSTSESTEWRSVKGGERTVYWRQDRDYWLDSGGRKDLRRVFVVIVKEAIL